MHKKEEILQFVNEIIADLEAKSDRNDQDNDELRLWKIHRDEIAVAPSDKALDKLVVFMAKTMEDLGLIYKLRL
ncbi:hypothetical protein [Chitinophaga sp.]|uniref:hypothetical protein n=1 Tax=Chitinophaga sp. TaxID=1869181 RepID=UPI0031E0A368